MHPRILLIYIFALIGVASAAGSFRNGTLTSAVDKREVDDEDVDLMIESGEQIVQLIVAILDLIQEIKEDNDQRRTFIAETTNQLGGAGYNVVVLHAGYKIEGQVSAYQATVGHRDMKIFFAKQGYEWQIENLGDGGFDNWGLSGMYWVRWDKIVKFHSSWDESTMGTWGQIRAKEDFPGWGQLHADSISESVTFQNIDANTVTGSLDPLSEIVISAVDSANNAGGDDNAKQTNFITSIGEVCTANGWNVMVLSGSHKIEGNPANRLANVGNTMMKVYVADQSMQWQIQAYKGEWGLNGWNWVRFDTIVRFYGNSGENSDNYAKILGADQFPGWGVIDAGTVRELT